MPPPLARVSALIAAVGAVLAAGATPAFAQALPPRPGQQERLALALMDELEAGDTAAAQALMALPAVEAEWTVLPASEANEAIQQHMLCWALCPKCEHVFYVQNGDIANRQAPRGQTSLVIILLTG